MRLLIFLSFLLFLLPHSAWGQPLVDGEVQINTSADGHGPITVALARALDERLTVWRAGRRRVYVSHCRHASMGCRARLLAMSRLIVEAAQRHSVDPFLLAAMALRESGLNPFAEGGIGERGIVQLHPRGVGARVPFVQNESYRRRCERDPGACQEEVLDVGARLIAASIARCGGIQAGLGCYNTGVCQITAYSRRVLRERDRLLHLAKAEPEAEPEGADDEPAPVPEREVSVDPVPAADTE